MGGGRNEEEEGIEVAWLERELVLVFSPKYEKL